MMIFNLKSYTQIDNWSNYDLDEIVSLEMPFTVYETDTIIEQHKNYQIFSSEDSSIFIAQIFYLDKQYSNTDLPTLPYNYESLKSFYLDIIWATEEVSEHKLHDFNIFKLNNLTGYTFNFKDKNDISVHETSLIYVNKKLYMFTYINELGLNEIDNNTFFNNINFNDKVELKQYPTKSYFINKKIILALFLILFISFILSILSKRKNQQN